MWHSLPKLFAVPAFTDQADTVAARWLRIIVLLLTVLILANSIGVIGGWLDQQNMVGILSANFTGILALGAIWIVVRVGRIKTATFLLLAILYILLTYINAVVFRSIRTPSVMTYFALIPLTGLLAGRRQMNWMAVISILTIGAIFYTETMGWLIPVEHTRTLFDDLVVIFMAIAMNTVLLNASVRRVEEKTDVVRQTAALLAQSNRALETSKAAIQAAQTGLEQKVQQRTEELRQNNERLEEEIAERQLLVEALVKSEANWRTLAEQVPDVIIRIEQDHTISFINRQLDRHTPQELLKQPATDIHDQSKYKRILKQALDQALTTGAVVTYETLEEIAGQQFWRINRVSAITEGAKIAAAILISTDVSEQKRAEAAMHQAQKMESLGLLAGGVAHDFNNLLTVIVMQTTLAIKKLTGNDPVREKLEKVLDAGERATDLTRQMLNYAGRNMLESQIFDLNTLILGNAHLFASAIPKNIKINTVLSPAELLMAGDKSQMQQVVMNLILNAADAIAPNSGHIRITTRFHHCTAAELADKQWLGEALTPDKYLLLEVEDDGCGMDAQTLNKIFDPFFTTKATGRGLGLASVIGIVRSHKGALHVASAPGKGTKFIILLPTAAPECVLLEDGAAANSFVGDNELVLVIDDEPMVREGIVEILTEANLRVLAAANGIEGVRQFRQHTDGLSLVLLDLAMPEMNGEDVFRELQQINAQVPVVIMSGHGKDKMLERIRMLKNVDFIQKPPTTGFLLYTVQSNLRYQEQLAEPDQHTPYLPV